MYEYGCWIISAFGRNCKIVHVLLHEFLKFFVNMVELSGTCRLTTIAQHLLGKTRKLNLLLGNERVRVFLQYSISFTAKCLFKWHTTEFMSTQLLTVMPSSTCMASMVRILFRRLIKTHGSFLLFLVQWNRWIYCSSTCWIVLTRTDEK